MGHSSVPDQNNALYGFKTNLKEKLRNGNLPRWLKDSPIHASGLQRGITVEEAFERGAQRARERRERANHDIENPTHPIQFVLDTGSSVAVNSRNPVPDKIWDKLNITRKDGQEYTGFHHCDPRDYRLEVMVGPRGGIDDLRIIRDFHH